MNLKWEEWWNKYYILIICVISTFLFGLIAHGYCFLNLTISHDSVAEFYLNDYLFEHKVSLGRIFHPIYLAITGGYIATPWLIGLLTMLWISLAVYLIVKIFGITNILYIILVSGICVVNPTVIANAGTYMHDLDINMFALLLSVASVYLWDISRTLEDKSKKNKNLLIASFLTSISLGIYQSYISVVLVLIAFKEIIMLLNQKTAKECIKEMAQGGFVIIAGLLYIIETKLMLLVCNMQLSSGQYDDLSRMSELLTTSWVSLIIQIYKNYIYSFLYIVNAYSRYIFLAIYIIVVFFVFRMLWKRGKNLGRLETLIMWFLIIAIPFLSSVASFLSAGLVHDIMKYAYWLIGVLLICFVQENEKGNAHKLKDRNLLKISVITLSLALLWGNIQTSNVVYVKKDLERSATLSKMTRVLGDIESSDGYIPGVTSVAIVGGHAGILETMPGFVKYTNVTGAGLPSQVSYMKTYENYFKYFLNAQINLILDENIGNDLTKNMPVYPEEGSIKMEEGILYVKLSDTE